LLFPGAPEIEAGLKPHKRAFEHMMGNAIVQQQSQSAIVRFALSKNQKISAEETTLLCTSSSSSSSSCTLSSNTTHISSKIRT
jgi:hypothetical protein